ncbi:MAG: class II fructose-bisphosphate aldolase [Thermomicrobiales bacterium]
MASSTRTPLTSLDELRQALDGIVTVRDDDLEIHDASGFRGGLIDRLVYTAVFGDGELRDAARWLIRVAAPKLGAFPASIHDLYMAAPNGAYSNATAPAINVRGLTYDMARSILRAARANHAKIVLFELARSEMSYTYQRPAEFASSVLAGAIKDGYQGPIFIQGDHYQALAKKYAQDPEAEIAAVRNLAKEAIAAGYYNIDVDASTLVDLSQPTLKEQQERNYVHTAELTESIRQHEPEGITVSIGGEIGEVGKHNSTVEDLHAFMGGYLLELQRWGETLGRDLPGISKISVQTGTSHGGVVLPDGTIASVNVDFDTLAALSNAAREEYGIGGAVQHGASTLPEEAFNRFAEANAIEVHLATAFQNQLYDSAAFPADLKERIYAHLAAKNADERKPDQTDAQFYYTTRKRGFGPFKRELWDLPTETITTLMGELEQTYGLVMQRLGVAGSAQVVDAHIKPVNVPIPAPDALKTAVTA